MTPATPVTKRDEIRSAEEGLLYKCRTAVCQILSVTQNDGRCRMADDTTTIEISHENWKWLSTLKERPSDSFDDVIRRQREQYERDVPDDDLATAYRERAEDLRDIRNDWENGQDEQPSDLETATAGHDAGAEGIMMDMGEALFGDIADGESRELQEEIEPVDMLDEPDLAD